MFPFTGHLGKVFVFSELSDDLNQIGPGFWYEPSFFCSINSLKAVASIVVSC